MSPTKTNLPFTEDFKMKQLPLSQGKSPFSTMTTTTASVTSAGSTEARTSTRGMPFGTVEKTTGPEPFTFTARSWPHHLDMRYALQPRDRLDCRKENLRVLTAEEARPVRYGRHETRSVRIRIMAGGTRTFTRRTDKQNTSASSGSRRRRMRRVLKRGERKRLKCIH